MSTNIAESREYSLCKFVMMAILPFTGLLVESSRKIQLGKKVI